MVNPTERTQNIFNGVINGVFRFIGALVGFTSASISAVIRLTFVLVAAASLILPTLFLSIAIVFSYFKKQKDYNPILSTFLGLLIGIYITEVLFSNSLNIIYPTIFHPFKGLFYGYNNGSRATLKQYRLEILNYPIQFIEGIKFYFSKLKDLFDTVNLSQNEYRNIIVQLNDDATQADIDNVTRTHDRMIKKQVSSRDIAEAWFNARINMDVTYNDRSIRHAIYNQMAINPTDNDIEIISRINSQRLSAIEQLNANNMTTRENTGLLKTLHSLMIKWTNDLYVRLHPQSGNYHRIQPADNILLLTDQEKAQVFVSRAELNKINLHISKHMTKASERLSEVIKSLDSDSCIISLSIPSQEDKIVVFTQYFDDNEDTWKSVPGKTHIFSESSFTHWLRIARTHPVTRDNIDAPKLHNGMRTRIKYCKVQENDTGYYCPELRDLANYFLDIINETTHSAVSRNRQTEINTTNHQEERQKGACVSLAGIFYINRRSDQHHNDSDEETASPGLN